MDIPITLTFTISVPDGFFATVPDSVPSSEETPNPVPAKPPRKKRATRKEMEARKEENRRAEVVGKSGVEGISVEDARKVVEGNQPDLIAVRAALYEYTSQDGRTGEDGMAMIEEICGPEINGKADLIPTDKYAELVEALGA